jgi:hypothetical protein
MSNYISSQFEIYKVTTNTVEKTMHPNFVLQAEIGNSAIKTWSTINSHKRKFVDSRNIFETLVYTDAS